MPDRFFATTTHAGPCVIDRLTGWRDPQPSLEEAEHVAHDSNEADRLTSTRSWTDAD